MSNSASEPDLYPQAWTVLAQAGSADQPAQPAQRNGGGWDGGHRRGRQPQPR